MSEQRTEWFLVALVFGVITFYTASCGMLTTALISVAAQIFCTYKYFTV